MPAFRSAVFAVTLLAASLHAQSAYVGSWASSQQIPEPGNDLSSADLTDATLRQIVHLSAGGSSVRVRFSNAFGRQPLRLSGAHLARALKPGSSAIDPATDRALSFGGASDVVIPAAAEYWSDPIAFPASAGSDLAVTLHLDGPPEGETAHPGSRATSFLVHGDALGAAELPDAKKVEHWFFLSGVDVAAVKRPGTVVVLGDSITDGHGSTLDGNDRWPDFLARRLQADKRFQDTGVLNEGIGGNHMLTDGLGPNALARLDRDVLAQTTVKTLIVLEGVNDLGYVARMTPAAAPGVRADLLHRLEASYTQVVERAHAHGIVVIGATILPYTGSDYYHPGVEDEAARVALNAWIRSPGHFDAVIDFDSVMADPKVRERLLPAYDCGDHLHPSPAGYKAMADAVPLALVGR